MLKNDALEQFSLCVSESVCTCRLCTDVCILILVSTHPYIYLWREDYWEKARKRNPFPMSWKSPRVTVSFRRSNCNPTLPQSQVKAHLPSLLPPPVKLIVHLLGSHSSLCSPERDNWIPHPWPQSHWWMALMGFYCLIYPLSSSFFSKSHLLSLYLFTLSAHNLLFYFIFAFVFIFHIHLTYSALQWDMVPFQQLMGLSLKSSPYKLCIFPTAI